MRSCTAKTIICPPSISNSRKKNNFGLNLRGHAASAARLVMKLVRRMRGIDRPSAPTDQVRPSSGNQLILSDICRSLTEGSYPLIYPATVIKNVINVIDNPYHRTTFPSPLSGRRGMPSAATIGNNIDKLNQGIILTQG